MEGDQQSSHLMSRSSQVVLRNAHTDPDKIRVQRLTGSVSSTRFHHPYEFSKPLHGPTLSQRDRASPCEIVAELSMWTGGRCEFEGCGVWVENEHGAQCLA